MLLLSAVIATGTLIACIIWHTAALISNNLPIRSDQIPFATLWEILSIGVICGAGTELILCGEKPRFFGIKMRFVVHCVFINIVVLAAGYFYGWYNLSVPGVLLMCLTCALVYAFTVRLSYTSDLWTANKMNKKLEELKEKGEK